MDKFEELTDLLNKYFDNTKKHINIIVLGGYNWSKIKDSNDNYKEWNNEKQCGYSDMENYINDKKKENIFIKITAVDSSYPFTKKDILIPHYRDSVYYNDTKYLDEKAHNIILTFSSQVLPMFYNFKANVMFPQYNDKPYNEEKIKTLKNYKITYLLTVPWFEKFPTNIIDNIIKYNIFTPVDIYDVQSYNYMISIKKKLNDNNITDIMKPYMKASFYILNTLMIFDNNEKNNKVMIDLLNNLDLSSVDIDIQNNINKFKSNSIEWNKLDVKTRKYFCNLVFNEELCMQQP
jgi:hypothetical protein